METKFPFREDYEGHKTIKNEYLVDALEEIPNFDDKYQQRDVIESNTNEEINENWDYNTEVNDETRRSGNSDSETTVNDEEPDNNSPKSPVTNDRYDNQGQSLRHGTRIRFLPKHLKEYVKDLPPSLQIPYPLMNQVLVRYILSLNMFHIISFLMIIELSW